MLPFMDELNGRIDPGYARVEEEMSTGILSGTKELAESELEYATSRDILQAKFAKIIVDTMIETANASGGNFGVLAMNGDKLTEITNNATRALLELVS